MDRIVKLESSKEINSGDAPTWNEDVVIKEENIELEIDPLSLCDEGIETDYESEEKFPYIDYPNWCKPSTVDSAQQSYVCFYCGELWNDRYGFKFHIKDVHMSGNSVKPLDKAFECFYCKRKFANIQRLVAHTNRKHKKIFGENNMIKKGKKGVKVFSCHFCNYSAKARCLVNYHIKRVHEKVKPFQCPHCDFRSAYSNGIQYHIKSKHNLSAEKLLVYEEKFTRRRKRNSRVMKAKEVYKPYACPDCDYRATRENILRNHLRYKHQKVTYYCPYCSFTTDQSEEIKAHIVKDHGNLKPFNCGQCNIQFSHSVDLKRHNKAFHDNKKKLFPCSHCDFSCLKVSELKSHTASEHGTVSTLYSCAHCNFVSYNLEELKLHATAEHGKVQLFSCPHCEFKCVQKDKLDSHVALRHKFGH